ncbi:MAG: sugar phosphate isomerase/epimerase [Acidobacteria bacterium]|nr:sugar phosphate isomerase/epimerase [Acidobacteriota bacterium]
MYNRRELGRATFAGLAAPFLTALAPAGREGGLGVQTCSFRGLKRTAGVDPIDTLVAAVAACGVRHCELFAPQVEAQFGSAHPGHHTMSAMSPQMMRRELRKWRLRVPDSYFGNIAGRFTRAGIAISAYNYSPNASFSDEEIDRGFEMAKALGAQLITASATLEVAKRIAPLADRHRMVVALQGAVPGGEPNALATPDSFAAALALSKYFRVNLDIGDFTAANFDAVAYVRDHHREVATLRLKDRRKTTGENLPWGEGDAPIREVLRLVKQEAWPIRGYVEYDYAGPTGAIDEVKKCLAYASEAMM